MNECCNIMLQYTNFKSFSKSKTDVKTYDCKIIYQDSHGYGDALKKGIETVETEFFCIFNADGSFNPKELDQMIKKLSLIHI